MDLFPKSNKDIFRRRIVVSTSEDDLIEAPSTKWRLSQWEKASQRSEDNKTALERQKEQTLPQVHEFLRRLEIAVLVHSKRKRTGPMKDWTKHQAMEHRLKEQMVLGHTLMAKVKELLELEEEGLKLSGSFRSSKSGSGSGLSIRQSADLLSQHSLYSSELRDLIRRFDHILRSRVRDLPHQIQELEFIDESKVSALASGKRDSLQFLTERLATDNIQLIFTTLPGKPSETMCTVSCKVFNITVEGRATERFAAKKAASIKMLERLVNSSLEKKIPHQITPFTAFDIKEAVGILCETEPYDEVLTQMCLERRKNRPYYETDSGKHYVRVRCSAFGLRGSGNYSNPLVSKRAAAREVIMQFKRQPQY